MRREKGVIDISIFPSLNEGKYVLKIYLSKSGAKGLGTELIKWSYNCHEGSHFHLDSLLDIYESMGVFLLPGSSNIIFEADFTNNESSEFFDEDYDENSDNTICAELVDVSNNAVLHNTVQFTFDKNAMRGLGGYLRQNNNTVNKSFVREINKAYGENSDILFRSNEKNLTAVEVIITENKSIDDYYR